MIPKAYRKRRVALPYEHGAYALFLCPLVIGLVAGGRWHVACLYLVVAATAGFLMRQPLAVLALIASGRRTRDDRPAAVFWTLAYAAIAAMHVGGLVARGHGYVLHLAVPGALVAAWHLALVVRRAERRQQLLEILATGVLALSAPAGLWIGREAYEPRGWLLWGLVWVGCATAIVHTYVRLAQRRQSPADRLAVRVRRARASLALSGANLALVAALSAGHVVSAWLLVPFALQAADVLFGALRPAHALAPKAIGLQQLLAMTLFTVAFLLTWA